MKKKKANGKVLVSVRMDREVRDKLHSLRWAYKAPMYAVLTDLIEREHARISRKEKRR